MNMVLSAAQTMAFFEGPKHIGIDMILDKSGFPCWLRAGNSKQQKTQKTQKQGNNQTNYYQKHFDNISRCSNMT